MGITARLEVVCGQSRCRSKITHEVALHIIKTLRAQSWRVSALLHSNSELTIHLHSSPSKQPHHSFHLLKFDANERGAQEWDLLLVLLASTSTSIIMISMQKKLRQPVCFCAVGLLLQVCTYGTTLRSSSLKYCGKQELCRWSQHCSGYFRPADNNRLTVYLWSEDTLLRSNCV